MRNAVLLLLAGIAAAGEVQLTGRAVEVVPNFATQHRRMRAFRPVGDAIRIGEANVPVARGKRSIRVGKKTVKAKGATVKIGPVRVFVRRRGDEWEYAAVTGRAFEDFEVVDVNADGAFDLENDGYRVPPSPFVLPFQAGLVLGRRRLAIRALAADGSRLDATVEPIEGSRHQLDGLLRINELRLGAGLPPVDLHPELSRATTLHARYLRQNRWAGQYNPHFEARGRRGFTPEGHRAGMASVIVMSDHASGVPGHWMTYYHRFAFQFPVMRGVGISDGTPSISVIDGKTGADWESPERAHWADPILVPADGSIHVRTNFTLGGEVPAPVEKAGTRGFPLTVLFTDRRPGVTGFSGELFRLKRQGEARVETLVPKSIGGGGRFGLIPARPLRSGNRYRVVYRFTRQGQAETITAEFATR